MKNYYDLFVQLSLQQCLRNDYGDKEKVKAHNKASKKLRQLQSEMKENDCADVLFNLLDYNDDRVRVNAAYLCLQMNIHTDKVLRTLKNVVDNTTDPTLAFSAKMALEGM